MPELRVDEVSEHLPPVEVLQEMELDGRPLLFVRNVEPIYTGNVIESTVEGRKTRRREKAGYNRTPQLGLVLCNDQGELIPLVNFTVDDLDKLLGV